ncbi:MAG: PocR ligand-binding domain-containing protein, partial [Clostridia bacterium]
MLAYDYEKLQIAVSSIHALVGAPVNIYDVEYQNIVRPQEPWNKEAFCYLMLRETQETAMACRKCYLTAFRETAKTKQMSYFKCHAGLTCVVVPIVHEDMVYGYLT